MRGVHEIASEVWECACGVLEDVVDGVVDAVPLGEELGEDGFAFGGELVEALVALVLFAPLAGEEALGFEAAKEGVEGAFFDARPWSARALRRV